MKTNIPIMETVTKCRHHGKIKKCKWCGGDFLSIKRTNPKRSVWSKFCSRKCSTSWFGNRIKIRNSKRKKPINIIVTRVRGKCKCGANISGYDVKKCKSCHDRDRRLSVMNQTVSDMMRRGNGDLYYGKHAYQKIRALAIRIMSESGAEKVCKCGYRLHVEVSHKKAISKFPKTATMAKVNSIDNLEYLCPNCHWEADNLAS